MTFLGTLWSYNLSWPYVVSGFLIGALVGLTGVGGGALMTPLLVLVFGVAPSTAVGTDLTFLFITKTVGTTVHGLREGIDWSVVRRLSLGSMTTTFLVSVWLWHAAKHGKSQNDFVRIALGVTLLLTAVTMIFRGFVSRTLSPLIGALTAPQRLLVTITLGVVIGILVSVTSVGAGAIGITALVLLYPDLSNRKLVGSDIAHAVPLTLIAGLFHWASGSVNVSILLSLLVGSIPAIILGSVLTAKISETVLRPLIAFALTLAGLKMVV